MIKAVTIFNLFLIVLISLFKVLSPQWMFEVKATLARRVPSAESLLPREHGVDLTTGAFMLTIKRIADAFERLGMFS